MKRVTEIINMERPFLKSVVLLKLKNNILFRKIKNEKPNFKIRSKQT